MDMGRGAARRTTRGHRQTDCHPHRSTRGSARRSDANELRYVASGQTDADMLQSTGNLLRQIATDSSWLAQLAARGTSSAAAVADTAAALGEVEGRARENVRAGLDLMAADLLFTETTRTRQMLREQLRALRLAESAAVADGRSKNVKRA